MLTASTREFLRHGQGAAPVPFVALSAGPIRMIYDPTTGFLRHLRLGDREVLRGIYGAVRDQNWGTVPGVLRALKTDIGEDRFWIEFEAVHRLNEIHFVWQGRLTGDPDGTVRYEFDGEARSTFRRNRIGFCLLHPIRECVGAPARQTRADGRVIGCSFPETIEPQVFGEARFQGLRAVAHQVEPGLWAEVAFEGDLFEMEDQRNWTDASFKTYCTPLTLPFPVEIRAGSVVRQRVCLRLEGERGIPSVIQAVARPGSAPVTVKIPERVADRLPAIGFGVASHDLPPSSLEITHLRVLAPAHLRVDVRLSVRDWAVAWDRSVSRASELGVGIELALHLPRQMAPDLDAVSEVLCRAGVPLVRVLVLREGESATGSHSLALVRQHLRRLDVAIGGGSDCNFCELNREQALGQFALTDSDFVFWSMNPQVHAFDRLSLVESLEAQEHTVVSARVFAGNRPLVISPVTFKQRFNPVATGPEPPPAVGELPAQVDPRQPSMFGAGWTLGSLAALTRAGAASVSYYETTGWRGLMETVDGGCMPERFPSRPLQVFPLYHVFAAVSGCHYGGAGLVSDPLAVTALALRDRTHKLRLLLANVTETARQVRVCDWPDPGAQVRQLDDSNGIEMTAAPERFMEQAGYWLAARNGVLLLELPPFAYVRIDA
jgi:D-apionolactonase